MRVLGRLYLALVTLAFVGACGGGYLAQGDRALAAGQLETAVDLYGKAMQDEGRSVVEQRLLEVARKELAPSFDKAQQLLDAGAPALALPRLTKLLQLGHYGRELPVPEEGLFPGVRGMYADALIEIYGAGDELPAAEPDLLAHLLFTLQRRFGGGSRFPTDLLEPLITPAIDAALTQGDGDTARSLASFYLSESSSLLQVDREQAEGHAKRAAALWSSYPGLAMAHAEMAHAGGVDVPRVTLPKLTHVTSTVPALHVVEVRAPGPCIDPLRRRLGGDSSQSATRAPNVDVEVEVSRCDEEREQRTETVYVPRTKRVNVSNSHYEAVQKPPKYQEQCDQVFYCRAGALKEQYWGALRTCNENDVYYTYECHDVPVSQGVEWVKRTETSQQTVTERVATTQPYTLQHWVVSGRIIVHMPDRRVSRAFSGRASADTRDKASAASLRQRALTLALRGLESAYHFVVAPTLRSNEGTERLAAGDPAGAADVFMRAWLHGDLPLYREQLDVIAGQLGVHVVQLQAVLDATPESNDVASAGWWRRGQGKRRSQALLLWEERARRRKARNKGVLMAENKQRLKERYEIEKARVARAGMEG